MSNTNIVLPPSYPKLEPGQSEVKPILLTWNRQRCLWIVADNNATDEKSLVFTWVITDKEGHTEQVIVSTIRDLPRKIKKSFGILDEPKGV